MKNILLFKIKRSLFKQRDIEPPVYKVNGLININYLGGMDLNLQQQLHRFMAEVSNGNIEIYNEFSI
jgi:hypothetical protein